MKHLVGLLVIGMVLLVAVTSVTADTIHLKNGVVINGTIVKEVPGESITIRTELRTEQSITHTYIMSEILEINRTSAFQTATKKDPIDAIYFNNGVNIKGVIIKDVIGESVTVRTESGTIYTYDKSEISNITRTSSFQELKNKNPEGSFFLSLLIPGLGQFYNGDHTKGCLLMGAWVIGSVLMVAGTEADIHTQSADEIYVQGFSICLMSYVYAIVDAPLTANKINKRNEQRANEQRAKEQLLISFNAAPSGLGAMLSVRF